MCNKGRTLLAGQGMVPTDTHHDQSGDEHSFEWQGQHIVQRDVVQHQVQNLHRWQWYPEVLGSNLIKERRKELNEKVGI
jgi:hypothetical protein